MASELTAFLDFRFAKSGNSGGVKLAMTANWAGTKWTRTRQTLSTSEEAINLGEATGGGGLCALVNRDASIAIHVRQASGAANFSTLQPGDFHFFRWSTSTTAPFVVAASGTPELEILTLTA